MKSILCLVILSLVCNSFATSTSEISALSDLYYATNGDNWFNNTNWFVGDPCASPDLTWYGVSCENNHVVALYLGENGLYGSIPESLIDLYNLDTISFYNNDIFGSIPNNWNEFRALVKINMKGNSLSGSIPESLGDLLGFNLNYLDLSENTIGGVLPSFFNNAQDIFVFIDLSNNEFVCPISPSAAYTKATCIFVTISGSQPTCVNNYIPFLVFGTNFGSLVNISCVYTNNISGAQNTSPALVVSDNLIQCSASYPFSDCSGAQGNRLYEIFSISLSSQGNIITGNSTVEIGVLNPYCIPGVHTINSITYTIPTENQVQELCSASKNPTPFSCVATTTASSSNTYVYADIDVNCTPTTNTSCIWLPADYSSIKNICLQYQCYNSGSCSQYYYCTSRSSFSNTCYSNPDDCTNNC